VKLDVAGRRAMEVGEGNGPVNALDAALRKR
jgi:2-isopropylmalate synthase